MITNRRGLRIISILMTILMAISFNSSLLPAFVAYAEGESTAETQAEKDAKNDDANIVFHAGVWSGPINDGLVSTWNYFHNAVQNHIRNSYTGIEKNEMTFDDMTSADLFKVIDNPNASDYCSVDWLYNINVSYDEIKSICNKNIIEHDKQEQESVRIKYQWILNRFRHNNS